MAEKRDAPLAIGSTYRLKSGYDIPVMGFGVYQTPAADSEDLVHHAISVGYRHVDSARAYHNEAGCTRGVVAGPPAKRVSRSALFFTTKVHPRAMSYASARADVEATLAGCPELEGYVDLYLLHAPYGGMQARLGAWQALVEAVGEGKVKSIGVSNYGVHHLEELEAYMQGREQRGEEGGVLSVNQVELHPWLARDDVVRWCRDRGVLLEAYSPLVRATRNDDPLLVPLSKKHNKTTAQILLRWSLQKGFVPLPKTVSKARIEENANVFDFELDADDMAKLDTGSYEPCTWDPTVSRD
ncbi:NADP-dependent oxidoreductase domain-containing protein [Phyllosticta citrichinensis]|uniref:NADP-dependent oxidoreductase domain-containing protein n=1 Tax=Phyllosticta citrichinensis TaxID=1130410 RepID=A0ABR1XTP5_9PEZI